jgi:hypothetical protein
VSAEEALAINEKADRLHRDIAAFRLNLAMLFNWLDPLAKTINVVADISRLIGKRHRSWIASQKSQSRLQTETRLPHPINSSIRIVIC